MSATGTTTLNFGSYPGAPEASVDVTGQTGLVSTSKMEAWVAPIATADHSTDEHEHENLRVTAIYKTDGTLTIKGYVIPFPLLLDRIWESNLLGCPQGVAEKQRLFGQFTVGWVWV